MNELDSAIRQAYRLVFGREAADAEVAYHRERIEAQHVPLHELYVCMLSSPEFEMRRRIVQPSIDAPADLEEFVRQAFRMALAREAQPQELAGCVDLIRTNRLPANYILKCLVTSPEYEKSLFPAHACRLRIIERLPRVDTIVDLGGSCPHSDEGALYFMGYRPKAKRLIIVDLPPQERTFEWLKTGDERRRIETAEGAVIEYAYGSIGDPGVLPESEIADLVWAGCSIEHVTEPEADAMLDTAMRVLKPGGDFCFDTANRRVTAALHGEAFSHPDHKVEYTHEQLVQKIRRHGFEIVEQLGVMDCQAILAEMRIDIAALVACPELTDTVENGYLLYYHCRKPAVPRQQPLLKTSA
jgi:SAM-dependent methyltransferase